METTNTINNIALRYLEVEQIRAAWESVQEMLPQVRMYWFGNKLEETYRQIVSVAKADSPDDIDGEYSPEYIVFLLVNDIASSANWQQVAEDALQKVSDWDAAVELHKNVPKYSGDEILSGH